MKLKLTGGDGSELILSGNNPVDFTLDLVNQTGEVENLIEINEALWNAFKYVNEMEYQTNENRSDIIYRHQNPMNPDENFDLTFAKYNQSQ